MECNLSIKYNCRHFKGSRPCFFHKKYNVQCDNCQYYEFIDKRILMIKVASQGDVLRTTGLLNAVKEKYQNSHITWITDTAALPLFENNNLVDSLLEADSSLTLLTLKTTIYDVVINLDADPESAMLATYASAEKKYGYGYSEKGYVFPFNKEAENWFLVGLSDPLKKANRKTYQQIMFEICDLDPSISARPVLKKSNYENTITQHFRNEHGISKYDIVIGMNTGAGRRWPLKRWTLEGYISLINRLLKCEDNMKIVLYGGPEEKEINAQIKKVSSIIIDSGCNNSLREFIALLDACDILVTGDTLAMHIAIALNKYIILLLGPTSYHEISLFGSGVKITSDMNCLCCYKSDCDKIENCMNTIYDETVFKYITQYLER